MINKSNKMGQILSLQDQSVNCLDKLLFNKSSPDMKIYPINDYKIEMLYKYGNNPDEYRIDFILTEELIEEPVEDNKYYIEDSYGIILDVV